MARTRNDENYDNKRLIIIEACIKQLMVDGIDNFRLNSLLEKMNMSKGVFFHYFSNKADLLDNAIEYASASIIENMRLISADETISAKEKFIKFYKTSSNHRISAASNSEFDVLTSKNKSFFDAVVDNVTEECTDFYEEIINQGIRENTFVVKNVKSAVFYILSLTLSINNEFSNIVLNGESIDEELINDKMEDFQKLMECLLGCERLGSLYDLSFLGRREYI